MNLTVLSINYKLAPVEVRERIAFSTGQLPSALREIRREVPLEELMVISTCNRVEFYCVARDTGECLQRLQRWLAARLGGSLGDVEAASVTLSHRAAVIHLLRVTCSLESMVMGEPQILGQVKDAYHVAAEQGSTGPVLAALLPRVFRAAKRVRTETEIARNAVSVSYAAVELAQRIFETLEDKTVLVVGAGEMAELAISHLRKQGIRRLLLANRTFTHAVELAEKHQGEVVPYEALHQRLPQADIVISSTGARDYILTHEQVRGVMKTRRGKPMFFIDIAVPRDIDPGINDVPNAYCYDIDDLTTVIDANRREREREARHAQEIIEVEAQRYERWYESLAAVPTIKSLRAAFHTVGERELQKALGRLEHLDDKDAEQVRHLVHSVLNKLLHAPSTALKQLAEEGNGKLYAETVQELFELREEEPARPPARRPDKVVTFSRSR